MSAENWFCAHLCTISFFTSIVDNVPDKIQILVLFMPENTNFSFISQFNLEKKVKTKCYFDWASLIVLWGMIFKNKNLVSLFKNDTQSFNLLKWSQLNVSVIRIEVSRQCVCIWIKLYNFNFISFNEIGWFVCSTETNFLSHNRSTEIKPLFINYLQSSYTYFNALSMHFVI